MASPPTPAGYYNHVFLKRLGDSKTMFGVLELYAEKSQCVIAVCEVKIEKIADIPVESSIHSSTYTTEFLDRLIDKLSKKHKVTLDKLQDESDRQELRLPALINWSDMGSERIYLIYTKVGSEKPWILTSSYIHVGKVGKKDKRVRVGFFIILPQSIAQDIKSMCLSDDRKSLTIRFGLKVASERGGEK